MSVRVPVMTIGSDSVAGVGDGSCARQIDAATAITKSVIEDLLEDCFGETPKPAREVRAGLALRALPRLKKGEWFFCTSNPPVSRGELAAEPFAPLSFFFFAKKFFRGPHAEDRRS
jgi:hypothetical protein